MQLDLSDEEASCLATFIRRSIDADAFPLAPRLLPLSAKLDPQPKAEPVPPAKPHVPSTAMRKKRRYGYNPPRARI
jgi:hypothetical protein